MRKTRLSCARALTAACFVAAAALAHAEPGDAQAVAKARKDYAEAMKGHDQGLQNAMRVELAAQLEMYRKHHQNRSHAKTAHPKDTKTSAG